MQESEPARDITWQQLAEVVRAMRNRWPKSTEVLERAEDGILAYMAFPKEQ